VPCVTHGRVGRWNKYNRGMRMVWEVGPTVALRSPHTPVLLILLQAHDDVPHTALDTALVCRSCGSCARSEACACEQAHLIIYLDGSDGQEVFGKLPHIVVA